MRLDKKRKIAVKRARRVRSRLAQSGGDRPRLSVFRSLQHIHAQIIDDRRGVTLAAASSVDKGFQKPDKDGKCAIAAHVGAVIAERAKAAGVSHIVFDRGPYPYHGRVKALAEAARQGGLIF